MKVGDIVRCVKGWDGKNPPIKADILYKVAVIVASGFDHTGQVLAGVIVVPAKPFKDSIFSYPYVWDISRFEVVPEIVNAAK